MVEIDISKEFKRKYESKRNRKRISLDIKTVMKIGNTLNKIDTYKVDKKKRITLPSRDFSFYRVYEFNNGVIMLEPLEE